MRVKLQQILSFTVIDVSYTNNKIYSVSSPSVYYFPWDLIEFEERGGTFFSKSKVETLKKCSVIFGGALIVFYLRLRPVRFLRVFARTEIIINCGQNIIVTRNACNMICERPDFFAATSASLQKNFPHIVYLYVSNYRARRIVHHTKISMQ